MNGFSAHLHSTKVKSLKNRIYSYFPPICHFQPFNFPGSMHFVLKDKKDELKKRNEYTKIKNRLPKTLKKT